MALLAQRIVDNTTPPKMAIFNRCAIQHARIWDMHARLLPTLFAALLASQVQAASLDGQVVAVADGDTLTLLVDRTQVKIRLAEIDAPERKQPFGNRSRQSLHELCHGKHAQVQDNGKDRYKRTIGQVTCAGIDANAEQVRRGMAWVYDKYSWPGSPLYVLQRQARNAKAGLWADAKPVPPWEWRAIKRNGL